MKYYAYQTVNNERQYFKALGLSVNVRHLGRPYETANQALEASYEMDCHMGPNEGFGIEIVAD